MAALEEMDFCCVDALEGASGQDIAFSKILALYTVTPRLSSEPAVARLPAVDAAWLEELVRVLGTPAAKRRRVWSTLDAPIVLEAAVNSFAAPKPKVRVIEQSSTTRAFALTGELSGP